MQTERLTLKVNGMTCQHCERTIETAVSACVGVLKVRADHVKSTVQVVYHPDSFRPKQLPDLIESAGYAIVTQCESKSKMWMKAALIMGGMIILHQLLNRLGVLSFVPEVQAGSSLLMVFLVGLMTSVHCVAMCGGISLAAGASRSASDMNSKDSSQSVQAQNMNIPREMNQKRQTVATKTAVIYNAGRILSYTLTGALAGLLGQVIAISDLGRMVIMSLAGLFMLVMGLNLLGLAPWVRRIRLPMPSALKNRPMKASRKMPLWIGLLNGLMPCGPLQMMQIYALGTGNVALGALSMFIFALGTTPMMFGISFFAGLIRGKKTQLIRVVSASLVILLGLQMMARVVDLPMLMQASQTNRQIQASDGTIANLEEDHQVVDTRFVNGRYQPIVVQAGIPVRWTITAEEGDLNGCNYSILIPSFDVAQDLDYGETIVEFLPEETGVIRYTCWMNMISSHINVVSSLP